MDDLLDLFKKLRTFRGRLSRSEFWFGFIMIGFLSNLLVALGIMLSGVSAMPGRCRVLLAFTLFLMMFFWLSVPFVKRLHDLNRSGWYLFTMMVPIWNIYTYVNLLFIEGTVGPNRYGPDPKRPFLSGPAPGNPDLGN